MQQTILSFDLIASNKIAGNESKRFMIARKVIDTIRKQLGRAIRDLNNHQDYGVLVGIKNVTGNKRVQSPCAISKWKLSLDPIDEEKGNDKPLTGKLHLILEEKLSISSQMMKQMIIMAASNADIQLSSFSVATVDVDYEILEKPVTYFIDGFVPGEIAPESLRGDKKAIKKRVIKTYPLARTPHAQHVLSQNCGRALKRHLIETAKFHGLSTEEIESLILNVNAYWIAHPQKKNSGDYERREALYLTFSAPIALSGCWFSGSYRHKGMGYIEKSTVPMKAGAFIL